ncbi:hypothetical protein BDN71DRAFT_1457965 [Pleurotus eryngii]|uniref:Uncharacterized protein n=1 Tax=Pleurotus eryngii TaxID=5323 RepID=A0A9P5ZIJ0_PLEER|nr:hypothetical protein BDN71DRAFT_1457965 [Pleurotus eryngii]
MQSRSTVENGLARGKPKERDAAVATLAEHRFKFCSLSTSAYSALLRPLSTQALHPRYVGRAGQ